MVRRLNIRRMVMLDRISPLAKDETSKTAMVKLVSVTPLPSYRLHLAYDDCSSGKVELAELVSTGVFNALSDPAVFATATLGQHGEVRWNAELELCGDALYLQLTGKSLEQLFPKIGTHSSA